MHRRLVFQASNFLEHDLYTLALQLTDTDAGEMIRKPFSDGEVLHQMVSVVNRRDVIVVGSAATNSTILDLYDTLCLVMAEGARGLTILIDDFNPMSKFERTCLLRMISAIPVAATGNRLVTLDGSTIDAEDLDIEILSAVSWEEQVRLVPEPQQDLELFPEETAPKVLFATSAYQGLCDEILGQGGSSLESGFAVDRSAGDFIEHLRASVYGRDVAIISGTVDDDETMALWYLANALSDAGAASLELVINYFGYARQERKSKSGEAVKAEYRARLFSHIPRCPVRNKVVMLDLHADGIPYYFDAKRVRAEHLYVAESLVRQVLLDVFGYDLEAAQAGDAEMQALAERLDLGSTDAGRAKWVEQMARSLRIDCAICHKSRRGQKEAGLADLQSTVYAYFGHVDGMHVVVYDDLLSTGGSAIKAHELYGGAGAADQVFVCTHGLFVGDGAEKLFNAVDSGGSRLLTCVYTTNTHPRALRAVAKLAADTGVPDFLRVFSVAPLIADYLLNGHPLDRARMAAAKVAFSLGATT